MAYKRYIVELGFGADLHGGNVTKAAQRAVKDAISRCCLCGLFDILGIRDPNQMQVQIRLGSPYPEQLNLAEVESVVPFGSVTVVAVAGGLDVQGLHLAALGEGDTIVAVAAAVTVYVNVP
ncbi:MULTISPECIES: Lin0512 family protein [Sporomusa]|uniref:Lin0512 family protein n=1 Tax=Sporomusa TaxID=2375 RepID=UPI00202DC9B5|nr:Lin0512 family protein [Sporomusa sphaeroides]MCM0760828.1 Lin0512 family protein [Sporomusa sphaeroides DSM 2875]